MAKILEGILDWEWEDSLLKGEGCGEYGINIIDEFKEYKDQKIRVTIELLEEGYNLAKDFVVNSDKPNTQKLVKGERR